VISCLPAVQEENPKSGLGQSAMVVVYATYLVASALSSEPSDDKTCNPLDMSGTTQTTSMIVGSVLTFLALAYSTSAAGTLILSHN
jgi:hypothetical protein